MTVLQVNCVYDNGSTGKIIKNLHHGLLARNWESYVCYARGSVNSDTNVNKLTSEGLVKLQSFFSKTTGFTYSCSPFTTFQLIRQINNIRPDIVNLHCINANTVNIAYIINFLKKKNIKTVITAHAEFLYTGGCGHALDCNKWISGCRSCPQFHSNDSQLPISYFFDRTEAYWRSLQKAYRDFHNLRVTGVSPWMVERIKRSSFFPQNNVFCTLNGVDTDIFCVRDNNYRDIHDIPKDGKVYLHVTPNFSDPLKGGDYVIEFAKKISEIRPNDRIIIIGKNSEKAALPHNVITKKQTTNQQELAEYYSMADVTLLTSKRETFSMVTAESLCCGTPVVGFQAGGPESICVKHHSRFVPYGDVDTLIDAAIGIEKTKSISSDYIPVFSIDAMVSQYQKVYQTF